jgi:hypothetical protein
MTHMTNPQTIAMVLARCCSASGAAEETTVCPRHVPAWLIPDHCGK